MTRIADTYIDQVIAALDAEMPGNPIELQRYYALLVLVKGTATSLEDVHGGWALWRHATRPDDPDMIPFEELPPDVQEYDRWYRDKIRKVAAALAGSGDPGRPPGIGAVARDRG